MFNSNLYIPLLGTFIIYIITFTRVKKYWEYINNKIDGYSSGNFLKYFITFLTIFFTIFIPLLKHTPNTVSEMIMEVVVSITFVILDLLLVEYSTKDKIITLINSTIFPGLGLLSLYVIFSLFHFNDLQVENNKLKLSELVLPNIKTGYTYEISNNSEYIKIPNIESECKIDQSKTNGGFIDVTLQGSSILIPHPIIKVEEQDDEIISGKAIIRQKIDDNAKTCLFNFAMEKKKLKELIADGSEINLIGKN